MITTLFGKNTFMVQQTARQRITAAYTQKGQQAVEQFDAADLSSQQLKSAITSINMFAPERLVVIRNISTNKGLLADLDIILPEAAPGVDVLIVSDGDLDKRTKAYKFLKQSSEFLEMTPPAEAKLVQWVQDQVKQAGGNITAPAARFLVAFAGQDQWKLANDIEKLTLFNTEITEAAIKNLVEPDLQANAFSLLDAALAGTKDWRKLFMQLQLSTDAYEFFGLLIWQVHAIALAATSNSPQQFAEAKLAPFVAQKSKQLAQKWGRQRVENTVRIIADLDTRLKSTGEDPWLLIERALVQMQEA